MGRKRTSPAPLRFRGAPDVVEALAPLTLEAPGEATLAVDVEERESVGLIAPVALQAEPAGPAATWLRFNLPATTPPGTYSGSVQVGSERYPITVEVRPQPDLAVSPSAFTVTVAPGGEAVLELTLVNTGNVPAQIGRTYAFNLLEPDGIEEAVHAALREKVKAGGRRLERFAEELADRHGGLVRVAVEEGSGTIGPGEAREVRAVLRFGDELRPGSTYTSTWRLVNLNLWVEVNVEPATPQRRRRETRRLQ